MRDDFAIRVKVIADGRRGRFVFRWVDQDGRPRQEASDYPAKPTLRGRAERAAQELEEKLNAARSEELDLPWSTFEQRYARDHLSGLAKKTANLWKTAANHLRSIVAPVTLSDVDAAAIARLSSVLRARGLSESSIATYLAAISAALGWAADMELIAAKPKVRKPKRARGARKKMRGRPLTGEEFDRFVAAVKAKRPDDHGEWQRLARGLWLSGLRLGEAYVLSWEFRSPLAVDLSGPSPVFRISAAAHKRGVNEILPMAPDFAEWLRATPQRQRRGRVFRVPCRLDTASKIVASFGAEAGIVVTPEGATATAHDLRRSFGTRWARRVRPAVLQRLMRHADIKTTMEYYVDLNTDEIGAELLAALPGGALGGATEADNNHQVAKERASREHTST